jgi:hypothetical protein
MDAPEAGLVLEQQHQRLARFQAQLGRGGLPSGPEVFLYASKASGVVRGWRGRSGQLAPVLSSQQGIEGTGGESMTGGLLQRLAQRPGGEHIAR